MLGNAATGATGMAAIVGPTSQALPKGMSSAESLKLVQGLLGGMGQPNEDEQLMALLGQMAPKPMADQGFNMNTNVGLGGLG